MKAGIYIGGVERLTIQSAKAAILEIIKSTANESVAVAGLNAFVALAKAPDNVSINNCSIISNTKPRK